MKQYKKHRGDDCSVSSMKRSLHWQAASLCLVSMIFLSGLFLTANDLRKPFLWFDFVVFSGKHDEEQCLVCSDEETRWRFYSLSKMEIYEIFVSDSEDEDIYTFYHLYSRYNDLAWEIDADIAAFVGCIFGIGVIYYVYHFSHANLQPTPYRPRRHDFKRVRRHVED